MRLPDATRLPRTVKGFLKSLGTVTASKSKEECVRIIFMAVRQDSVPYLQGILNPSQAIYVAKSHRKKKETNALQGKCLFADR